MSENAFNKIAAGLRDATAHAREHGSAPSATMLEKMANAMAERLYQIEIDEGEDGPDCYRRLGLGEYALMARAALEALRKVDEKVLTAVAEAGLSAVQCGSVWPEESSAGLLVNAMIDSILSNPK